MHPTVFELEKMETPSLTPKNYLLKTCKRLLGVGSTSWNKRRLAVAIKLEYMRLASLDACGIR